MTTIVPGDRRGFFRRLIPADPVVAAARDAVDALRYMYSSLNVGHTIGAMTGGLALATDSLAVIRWTPVFAAVMMLANAFWISRLPAAPHDLRVASGERRVRPTGPSVRMAERFRDRHFPPEGGEADVVGEAGNPRLTGDSAGLSGIAVPVNPGEPPVDRGFPGPA